jgi:hypothetical protein
MEAAGLAASITRLAAAAGQALEGIIQLRAFFKDVSLAPRRIADLLNDLESLEKTLSNIQQLVTTLERTSTEQSRPGAGLGGNTGILKAHLKACADDIVRWVKITKEADPRSEKGIKGFFKKVKIAADKSGFAELGGKISTHRQRIGMRLSVLGR